MNYEFHPKKFWFIKLRDYGNRGERKKPAEAWGGYSTDFEENDNVYSYMETVKSPHKNFAIVGYKDENHQLVVLDLDSHKIDDFDPTKMNRPLDGVPIIKSVKEGREIPGFHFYILLSDKELSIQGAQDYVDIKANKKGHVVSPWHNDDYVLAKQSRMSPFPNVTELNRVFDYDGKALMSSRYEYSGELDDDVDFEPKTCPPNELPKCIKDLLTMRRDIPRDGTYQNPWKLDSALGRRLVAHGYEKSRAMNFLENYPPQDGYDERESSYQLDLLYQKQLIPESTSTLRELGVFDEDEWCACDVCRRYMSDEVSKEVRDTFIAPNISTTLEEI